MLASLQEDVWTEFLTFIKPRCSSVEFENWFAPIQCLSADEEKVRLEVPNIFVREYLVDNYKKDLAEFLPLDSHGRLSIEFVIREEKPIQEAPVETPREEVASGYEIKLNSYYTFENFIEGPSNQFIKSAAVGVASRPGKSYNLFFIHGGVGLGKTHLLHGIGHYIRTHHKKLKIHCITTEGFINDLVSHLRSKSIDKMKRFYRNLDVLLVDDIQFLQNRLNFEEEFCNTFEALINSSKQIVVTSDKPPSQLKLSERMVARMEWGLVAQVGVPDLETRVAILQHKAEERGISIPSRIAFFIAEHIYHNVRQLEGAINRLGAYCRLMHLDITQDVVESTLGEMLQTTTTGKKVTVETILQSVSAMYDVRVSDLKGTSRSKEVAFPRQIAMYLAKELIGDSLMKIASAFGGKTHSTLLHAWKKVASQIEQDELLKRKIQMTKQNIID
ncbi:MAG: chromosomal replication initiator protein DnaA [Simkaniaceae bacterium]|nr:chromosomal replication initiator protein DnaA [Simkaniaceae bacterium]